MIEEGTVAFGDAQILYSVVRSARRHKTVEITVKRPGEVVVAAPTRSSRADLEAIVRRRAGWILRHDGAGDRRPWDRRYANGGSVPYLGREVRMFLRRSVTDRVEVHFGHWQFDVQVPRDTADVDEHAVIASAFRAWYRARAARAVGLRVARFAPKLDVEPAAVLVRDQHRRWGSCAPNGTLRFNWRIVMAPPALIDYVVVHELAHLRTRSHGARYWALVAQLVPDHRLRRERLRLLGPSLDL